MNRVSQAEFARLCGVNRSTVNRWLKTGRIQADASGRIDPEAAARMREATESPLPHHQARKAQFDEAKEATGQGQGPSAPLPGSAGAEDDEELAGVEDLGRRMKRATIDLQERKAEIAALEIDRMAGALVDRADVDFVLSDAGAMFRTELETMPDRMTGELLSLRGDAAGMHKALEDWAREASDRVSEQMVRRAAERFTLGGA